MATGRSRTCTLEIGKLGRFWIRNRGNLKRVILEVYDEIPLEEIRIGLHGMFGRCVWPRSNGNKGVESAVVDLWSFSARNSLSRKRVSLPIHLMYLTPWCSSCKGCIESFTTSLNAEMRATQKKIEFVGVWVGNAYLKASATLGLWISEPLHLQFSRERRSIEWAAGIQWQVCLAALARNVYAGCIAGAGDSGYND